MGIITGFKIYPVNEGNGIAVIELYTSQGCSSCPPADRLLSETIAKAKKDGSKIFALSFHVDYWNRLGWKDPFSDHKFSERQRVYADAMKLSSVYTPQMIVNGHNKITGSERTALANALNTALTEPALVKFKQLSAISVRKTYRVQYDVYGTIARCKINFALVSLRETTTVNQGENSGRTLENENVVRQLISIEAKQTGMIDFAPEPVPQENNIAIIAFV